MAPDSQSLRCPPPASVDAVVEQLLYRTRSHLERLVDDRVLRWINERDHLEPALARAAVELLGHEAVKAQFVVALTTWPGLGAADVALRLLGDRPTILELKAGHGVNALGPCVWDGLKAAALLQAGLVERAFLVAAARREEWRRPVRGAEFFADAEHATDELRDRYGDWFRSWQRHGDPQPLELPDRWRTRAVAGTALTVAGVAWEVRAAEVVVEERGRIPWPRLPTD